MKPIKSKISFLAAALLFAVLSVGCTKEVKHPIPTIKIESTDVTSSSVSFSLTYTDAEKVVWSCVEKGTDAQSVDDLLLKGTAVSDLAGSNTVTVSDLKPATTYVVYAAASGKGGVVDTSLEVDTEWFVFTSASAENYGGTNYSLVFTAQLGETLSLDAYCDAFKYLPEGVYNVAGDANPMIDVTYIDYTNYTVNGEKKALKSGTVDVKVDAEKQVYDVTFDIVLADETPLKAKYSGAIEGSEIFDAVQFKLIEAKRLDIDNASDGEFYIKLNDSEWAFEASLDFFAAAGAKELPVGKYVVGEGKTEGTLGTNSQINPYRISGVSGGKLKSGYVEVTKTDNTYKFVIDAVDVNNQKFNGEFEGEIKDMILPIKVAFTSATADTYPGSTTNNYSLTFTDGNGNELALDTYFNTYKFLSAGTYKVAGSSNPYIDTDKNYTYFSSNGTKLGLTSGSMVVSPDLSTKKYDISFDFLLEDGSKFKGTYNGEITNSPIFDEFGFTLNKAKRADVNGAVPGEFYIKLNDSDWKFDVVLDFFTQNASAAELPAGTYEFSENTATGLCFGPKSEITCYSQPVSGGKFKSGKIVVSKSGSNYTISIDAKDATDQRFVGTFEGEIENMAL
jgi:hypothetical protein